MANKKRRCTHCKDYQEADLGVIHPAGFFCSHNHAIEYARAKQERDRERKAKKAISSHQKERKAAKKANKDVRKREVQYQHDLTQPVFNKMRRLEELKWFSDRSLKPICISCGNPLGGDHWACGHFKTVSSQGMIRYDRKNTYLQHNVRCNKNLSGDIYGTKTTQGYIKGLLERFGQDEGQKIIDYCESHTAPRKWEWDELERMRAGFNARIRELEKID